jgi:hypothetical protein
VEVDYINNRRYNMKWYEMPETTDKEKAEKEIAECNYCINGLIKTMRTMKVPEREWGKNIMIKTYLERINKARLILG